MCLKVEEYESFHMSERFHVEYVTSRKVSGLGRWRLKKWNIYIVLNRAHLYLLLYVEYVTYRKVSRLGRERLEKWNIYIVLNWAHLSSLLTDRIEGSPSIFIYYRWIDLNNNSRKNLRSTFVFLAFMPYSTWEMLSFPYHLEWLLCSNRAWWGVWAPLREGATPGIEYCKPHYIHCLV